MPGGMPTQLNQAGWGTLLVLLLPLNLPSPILLLLRSARGRLAQGLERWRGILTSRIQDLMPEKKLIRI